MKDALAGLAVPARALVVALLGALWAWWWFRGYEVLAAVVALALLGVGIAIGAAGSSRLPARPLLAIRLMEWWIIVPMTIAAIASAVTIIVAVELALPTGTAADIETTVAALGTAVTTFLASGFVDWAADDKDSRLSERIRDRFYAAYNTQFEAGSAPDRFIYSGNFGGAEGWSRASRRIRAAGIAKHLSA